MLYSIIPNEMVFQDSAYWKDIKLFEADYMGERIQIAQKLDKSYAITRLLSTNLNSYLNPALQPGNIVDARELKIQDH